MSSQEHNISFPALASQRVRPLSDEIPVFAGQKEIRLFVFDDRDKAESAADETIVRAVVIDHGNFPDHTGAGTWFSVECMGVKMFHGYTFAGSQDQFFTGVHGAGHAIDADRERTFAKGIGRGIRME